MIASSGAAVPEAVPTRLVVAALVGHMLSSPVVFGVR